MAEIKLNLDSLKPQKEIIRHKLQSGVNILRILPPFGPNANGWIYKQWSIIWGLIDPQTSKTKPYSSSFSTEKKCPFYEYSKLVEPAIKEYVDNFTKDLKNKGYSDQAILKEKQENKSYQKIIAIQQMIKPRTSFFYNAADKSGKVGVLELRPTAHDQLKNVLTKYIEDYQQDPTSMYNKEDDKGLWIKITKTGVFRDTRYTVEKNQVIQKMQGQMVYLDDRDPLPETVVSGFEKQAIDLSSLYQVKKYEELKDLLVVNIAPHLKEFPFLNVKEFFPIESVETEEKKVDEIISNKVPINATVAKQATALKEMFKSDPTEIVDEIDNLMDQYENLLK